MSDRHQIMIDIETLGTERNAVVLSVGAAVMDVEAGTIVHTEYWVLDTKAQDQEGRSLDSETVMWWLGQSEDARNAFRKIGPKTAPTDFIDQLYALFKRYRTQTAWANGTDFDLKILEHFFPDCTKNGKLRDKCQEGRHCEWTIFPWNYSGRLCMRSLRALMAQSFPYEQFKKGREFTAHNALDDAVCQAEYVLECMKRISHEG